LRINLERRGGRGSCFGGVAKHTYHSEVLDEVARGFVADPASAESPRTQR
jgi:hypothetical protein